MNEETKPVCSSDLVPPLPVATAGLSVAEQRLGAAGKAALVIEEWVRLEIIARVRQELREAEKGNDTFNRGWWRGAEAALVTLEKTVDRIKREGPRGGTTASEPRREGDHATGDQHPGAGSTD